MKRTKWNSWGHTISYKSWRWNNKPKILLSGSTQHTWSQLALLWTWILKTNTNLHLAWHWSHCSLYPQDSRFDSAAQWLLKLKIDHVQRMLIKCNSCIKKKNLISQQHANSLYTLLTGSLSSTDLELSIFCNLFLNLALSQRTKMPLWVQWQHPRPSVYIALWNLRVFFDYFFVLS